MHDIEPYFGWRGKYVSSEDEQSLYYGKVYDEFKFVNKVYNYFVHPQWDQFGSETLYLKVLFVDYDEGFAVIEFLGEWNDCLRNDIMFLKREIIDKMIHQGIFKFVLLCEHVMDFHASDDSYYEEWFDDIKEESGWICCLETRRHMQEEMNNQRLNHYVNYGAAFNLINWRKKKPLHLLEELERQLRQQTKSLN